ncbi:hypothetical protein [Pantoea agglomerans]|uniref:hypothetical protein n=1 Tax=Enterobacter agglomerans TaxID=549 RepID=UPI00301BBBC4
MSNRDIQPFQFACPKCEQRITFTIGDDKGDLEGATDSLDFKWPFKEKNPFVDLHLDFPVYFGKYVKGMTTFFRVMDEIGQDAFSHLAFRLEVLNKLHPLKKELESVITQYKKGDIKNSRRFVKKSLVLTLKPRKGRMCLPHSTQQRQLCLRLLRFMRKMKSLQKDCHSFIFIFTVHIMINPLILLIK